jgi:DNA-binding NarL/FixJ family response regulator
MSGSNVRRVLIVDDAADTRMLIRLQLDSAARYDIVGEAVDGIDAVNQARDLQPNLVLLDLDMPRMDGLAALPLIRDAAPDVRVIVMSAYQQGTYHDDALAAGADRYVVKGITRQDLLEVIETVLAA